MTIKTNNADWKEQILWHYSLSIPNKGCCLSFRLGNKDAKGYEIIYIFYYKLVVLPFDSLE